MVGSSRTATTEAPGAEDADDGLAAPVAGIVLLDRFELVQRIGSGGSGSVFRALDRHSNRVVALKLLKDSEGLSRFKHEFRLHHGLAHPHLLAPDELVSSDSVAVITMKLLSDALPLDAALQQTRDDERVATLRRWFGQLADAIDSLHQHGLLHGDIKPANVLVDAARNVQLIDFGAALRFREGEPVRTMTRSYAAPEVRIGQPAKRAADWYSFGMLLQDCLSVVAVPPSELVLLSEALRVEDPARRAGAVDVFEALGRDRRVPPSERFVGRHAELGWLEQHVCRGEGAAFINVRGPSGIGKSALVQKFSGTHAKEALVLHATNSEFESVPYGALDDLVEQVAVHLERMGPGTVAVSNAERDIVRQVLPRLAKVLPSGSEPSAWVGESVADTVRIAIDVLARCLLAASKGRLVVLVLDRVEWAGRDCARMVSALVERMSEDAVRVIQVYRADGEHTSEYLLEQSERPARVPVYCFTLGALPLEDARRLCPHLSSRDAERLVSECGGNPQLIVQQVSEKGALRRRLPASALATAELLAIAGQPVSTSLVASIVGEEGVSPAALRILDELGLASRESSAEGKSLRPPHDLIAERIGASLTLERRQHLHGALAAGLAEQEPVPHDSVALHYEQSKRLDLAAEHARRAADRAGEVLAFETQARWLQRALRWQPDYSPRPLMHELARALSHAGHGWDSAQRYLKLATSSERHAASEYRLEAAKQSFRSGHLKEGFAILKPLMDAEGFSQPNTILGALLGLTWQRLLLHRELQATWPRTAGDDKAFHRVDVAATARTGYMSIDFVRGALFAALSLRLALRAGEPSRIAVGLCDEAMFLANAGTKRRHRFTPLLVQARELASESGDGAAVAYSQVATGGAALMVGDFVDAMATLSSAERLLRQRHPALTWELTLCRMFLVTAMQFGGCVGRTESLLHGWMEDARRRGDHTALRYFAPEQVLAALAIDDPKLALARFEQTKLDTGQYDDQSKATLLHQAYFLAMYTPGQEASLTTLDTGFRQFYRSPMSYSQGLRCTSLTFDANRQLQLIKARGPSRSRVRRVLRFVRRLRSEGAAYASAQAELIDATLERLLDPSIVPTRLEKCVARLEAAQCVLAAMCLRRQLETLKDSRQLEEANERLLESGVRRPEHFARLFAPALV